MRIFINVILSGITVIIGITFAQRQRWFCAYGDHIVLTSSPGQRGLTRREASWGAWGGRWWAGGQASTCCQVALSYSPRLVTSES